MEKTHLLVAHASSNDAQKKSRFKSLTSQASSQISLQLNEYQTALNKFNLFDYYHISCSMRFSYYFFQHTPNRFVKFLNFRKKIRFPAKNFFSLINFIPKSEHLSINRFQKPIQ